MTDLAEPYLDHLHCLKCGYVFSEVIEHEGRTAISLMLVDGTESKIFRATLTCPICGAERKFYSEPLSGIRIGVV